MRKVYKYHNLPQEVKLIALKKVIFLKSRELITDNNFQAAAHYYANATYDDVSDIIDNYIFDENGDIIYDSFVYINEREIVVRIINEFEKLLEKYDITIPDNDREGDDEEGRIFGQEYYALEDNIKNILRGYE